MSKQLAAASSSKLCGLCDTNASKYCCPRCEVFYCSLSCYKSEKHLSCSEGFYQDCVNEELSLHHTDAESKNKMLEILKRMRYEDASEDIGDEQTFDQYEEGEDSDDNDDDDLQERLKGLDLNDADAVWNVLTEDERNEFEALLSQGDVGGILPQWEPWWSYSKDARLVQDVSNNEEEEALGNCPEIINAPKFDSLTSVQPAPTIKFNITNVLASYAFVMRYFNGELEPYEGMAHILNVCANLDANMNFDDAVTAVESVKQKCLQCQHIQTDEATLEVMKRDTFFLLQGPSEENKLHYCKSALSHLFLTLLEAKNNMKRSKGENKVIPEEKTKLPKINEKSGKLQENTEKVFSKKFPDQKGDYLPKLDYSKLRKCLKKVEFYLSYVECYGMDFE